MLQVATAERERLQSFTEIAAAGIFARHYICCLGHAGAGCPTCHTFLSGFAMVLSPGGKMSLQCCVIYRPFTQAHRLIKVEQCKRKAEVGGLRSLNSNGVCLRRHALGVTRIAPVTNERQTLFRHLQILF